jgi:hypothetical protein
VKYNVTTFCAKTLSTKHTKERTAPAMVTARQPYLFTNELEIGPAEVTQEAILENADHLKNNSHPLPNNEVEEKTYYFWGFTS